MIEDVLRGTTPRSIRRVVLKLGSNFEIYRNTFNEYNEPVNKQLICRGKGLYHEAIYRQMANEYSEYGVSLRNLPGKYIKTLPDLVEITPVGVEEGITLEDFSGTVKRGDLLKYDNRMYTIINTGDNEAIRSSYISFMIEEVSPDATQQY